MMFIPVSDIFQLLSLFNVDLACVQMPPPPHQKKIVRGGDICTQVNVNLTSETQTSCKACFTVLCRMQVHVIRIRMCIRENTFVLINYAHYRHNCAAFKMPVKIWYKFGKFFGTEF